MIRVVAPSRLHFGLLHVPTPDLPGMRKFGGLGLMVDKPGLAVRVEISDAWEASGPSSDRALAIAKKTVEGLVEEVRRPLRVIVEHCPPEHVGLGVGTQLSLAILDTVTEAFAGAHYNADWIAILSGRGKRSRIGVYGYREGGLIVDCGHPPDCSSRSRRLPEISSSVLTRLDLPPDWRILLARPMVSAGWHGDAERRAFARPRDPVKAQQTTDTLCRHLLLGVLPAVKECEFTHFSESLYAFNRLAGEAFAADQGGPYAGPVVSGLIELLRSWGISGVGQTSWGPTVFAMIESEEEAQRLAQRLTNEVAGLESVVVAKPSIRGASIFRDGALLYQNAEQPNEEHIRGEHE